MIIRKINLKNYGKFENKEFSFSDKLNIIYGENESGKSTISTALKTFLYSEINQKKKYKKKYIPLNEKSGEFDVTFTHNDEEYDSFVTVGMTNAKTSVKTVNRNSGEVLNTENREIGEFLFDTSEEFFDSVYYIKDISGFSDYSLNKSSVQDVLTKEKSSLMLDTDLNETIEKINDELKVYIRKTATGKIYPLYEELETLNDFERKLTDIKEGIKEINIDKERITARVQELKKKEEELKEKTEYGKIYIDYKNTKEQLKLKERIEKINNELKETKSFSPIREDELLKIKSLYETKEVKKPTFTNLWISGILLLLSAGLSFINIFLSVISLLSVPFIISYFKSKKLFTEFLSKKEELEKTLELYNIKDLNEYYKRKEEYDEFIKNKEILKNELNIISRNVKEYNNKYENIYLKEPCYDLSGVEKELENVKEEMASLTFKLTEISSEEKNAFKNLPDYSKVIERKEEIEELIRKRTYEQNIIKDALLVLETTKKTFKSSYIPHLNDKVKKILKDIYGEVDYFSLDDDMHFDIRKKDENKIKNIDSVSSGFYDIIYFALRLATIEILKESGNDIPLVIDDAFIELDNENYKKVMMYLDKIYEGQIIYFSAHKRNFDLILENTSVIVVK